jgi:hypothetical protein
MPQQHPGRSPRAPLWIDEEEALTIYRALLARSKKNRKDERKLTEKVDRDPRFLAFAHGHAFKADVSERMARRIARLYPAITREKDDESG